MRARTLGFIALAAMTILSGPPPAMAGRSRVASDPWQGLADDERVVDRIAMAARKGALPAVSAARPLPLVWRQALGIMASSPAERMLRARRVARHWPEDGLPSLRILLGHGEPVVREQAAHILGYMADAGAPPFLMLHVADPVARVRAAMLAALGRTAARRAQRSLEAALADPDPGVRQVAREGLGGIGTGRDALMRAAGRLPVAERLACWAALSRLPGRQDGRALQELLFSPAGVAAWRSGIPEVQVILRGLARRLELDQIEQLAAFVHASDPQVRRLAVAVLEEALNPAVGSVFTAALQDSDEEVRGRAAAALGRLGDPVAVPALVEGLLRGDLRWAGADQALLALWRLEARSVLPRLREAARPAVGAVQPGVLILLGHWGTVADLPLLARRLEDSEPSVRLAATRAVGLILDKSSLPACPAPPAAALGTDALLAPGTQAGRPDCPQHHVLPALADTDAAVALAGLDVVRRHPSAWLVPDVVRLATGPGRTVRNAALPTLAALGVPGLEGRLLPEVEAGMPAALEAAWILGGPLGDLARDVAMASRDAALRGRWLARLEGGGGGAFRMSDVSAFLRDPDPALRARAARLAWRGGVPRERWPGPDQLEPLSAARLWAGAASLPGKAGAAARGRWLGALSHPDPIVRLAATEALGGVPTADMLGPLGLRARDRDPEVARAAWRAALRWTDPGSERLVSGLISGGGAAARGVLDACPADHPRRDAWVRIGRASVDPRVRWAAERLARRVGEPASRGNP
ncbi:MAG: HEAT repeat domain-containing protein [Candidatus Sericytochromatia bacterium]|nr:HEAT repeat domain-containing protein [Candidatus Sericytochromatia bacterium]